MHKIYKYTLLILIFFVAGLSFLPAGKAAAQGTLTNVATFADLSPTSSESCQSISDNGKSSGTSINCVNTVPDPGTCTDGQSAAKGCGIVGKIINPAIVFFSAAFGVIVTIMIIIGGIQYASAEGDPQKVANAKKRIFNALFALVAYALLYGALTFLIPGGL